MRTHNSLHAKKRSDLLYQSSIETLESRCLKSATIASTTTNTLSDISGTNVAQIQVGDNGAIGGVPGTVITTNGTETSAADVEWCSDESNGFATGWQQLQFSVNAGSGGTTTLAVPDSATLTSSTGGSTFSQVTISSAVAGWGMAMQFAGVQVNFYNGTTLLDSEQIASVDVDTTNEDNNDPQQSITTISTSLTNCTSVQVTAEVQMYSVAGEYPGEMDIAGAIAVS